MLMSADFAAVRCRGVRGATFIDEDTPEAILAGTRELPAAIARANGIATEDIASAFFTSTADLRSAFPARAARDLGWTDVPLLGATEVDKPGAPPRCIRVLLHWNTSRRQDEIVHVYLRGSAEPPGIQCTRGGPQCVTAPPVLPRAHIRRSCVTH